VKNQFGLIKLVVLFLVVAAVPAAVYLYVLQSRVNLSEHNPSPVLPDFNPPGKPVTEAAELHPLSIESMVRREYPGSEVVIEQELPQGSNHKIYVASYFSEGLKIYALLTVPNEIPPAGGYPAIIFNHGYIPPEQYSTTQRYESYVGAFARNGYVVFKPDYRGHGNSEGFPEGAYFSPAYTIDVLNAVTSVKRMPEVNPEKIGMWGHSMGGSITLRSMVVTKDIKAGVIWAGVVGSYEDMFKQWSRRSSSWRPSSRESNPNRPTRAGMAERYGDPIQNPEFWDSLSPVKFVNDISGPVQIHHGTADSSVPLIYSTKLYEALVEAGKEAELYEYEGADHNISGAHFTPATQRSVEFFDRYLK
jgi:uncharacterized protein